ncbi:hypothetical protein niasHS_000150 [Heterodera schachtii]|uniref:Uncharacterized protein n=1 Tax=Heterodera schachtii TaxID=97005 RepID=A0ABD2KNX3_HETSC
MRRILQNLVMCAASDVIQQEAAFVSFYSTLILIVCRLRCIAFWQFAYTSEGQKTTLKVWLSNLFAITSLSDLTKWAIVCSVTFLIIATATNGPFCIFAVLTTKKPFKNNSVRFAKHWQHQQKQKVASGGDQN